MVKPNVGYLRDALNPLKEKIQINEYRRDWDKKLYPYAKKGFFPYKKAVMSNILKEILE